MGVLSGIIWTVVYLFGFMGVLLCAILLIGYCCQNRLIYMVSGLPLTQTTNDLQERLLKTRRNREALKREDFLSRK